MSLIKGLGISILLQLSFTNIIATNSGCSTSFESTNDECLQEYQSEMNTAQQKGAHPDIKAEIAFRNYLKDLPNPSYLWYTHWNDLQANDNLDINYCVAIEVIDSVSANQCLCQLKVSCDDICDNQIEDLFITETNGLFLDPFPTGLVTPSQCQNVLQQIQNKQYDILCSETQAYIDIVTCAGGINTLSPNATPNPTLRPIQTPSPTTPTPTTPAPTNTQSDNHTTNTPQTTKSSTESASTTTDTPTTTTILTGDGDSNASTTTTTQQPSTPLNTSDYNDSYIETNTTTWLQKQERGNDTDTDVDTYVYPWTSSSTRTGTLDVTGNSSTTASTSAQLANATPPNESHPFANLLLVSLIILGFCVFVAWYAKKNQIATDGSQGNEEDNGYLWGLTQSSPSNDQRMEVKNGNNNKRGKSRHKKLISQFDDDELDQEMNIQMGKMSNNNDLLAITPDHVGRLQTRGVAPNQLAPKIPHNKKSKRNRKRDTKRTKRGGKHGKFEQVKDDEDPCPDDSDSDDDSESGEDMMKMRDQYYASQTFGKKLVDTLGDIHDTVKVTAQAVKTKLTKKEPTVVRPMQMGGSGGGKKTKSRKKDKRPPFTMVNEEETTDGFDLSGDDDSASTQEDEYREDSETEVRMNIHGRKIKQPMKLPTFDDDDDEEIDLTATQNIDKKSKKKKKKKDKKRKKKKEKKERESKQQLQQQQQQEEVQQVEQEEVVEEIVNEKVEIKAEVHDINITINNDDKMGFGTDELEEDDNIDLSKTNIDDLSKDDEAMTMMELEKELMNAGRNDNDNTDNNNNPDTANVVDLSFMDVVDNNTNNDNIEINVESNVINNDNEDNNDELLNGNGVVGNGNVPHQD